MNPIIQLDDSVVNYKPPITFRGRTIETLQDIGFTFVSKNGVDLICRLLLHNNINPDNLTNVSNLVNLLISSDYLSSDDYIYPMSTSNKSKFSLPSYIGRIFTKIIRPYNYTHKSQ